MNSWLDTKQKEDGNEITQQKRDCYLDETERLTVDTKNDRAANLEGMFKECNLDFRDEEIWGNQF